MSRPRCVIPAASAFALAKGRSGPRIWCTLLSVRCVPGRESPTAAPNAELTRAARLRVPGAPPQRLLEKKRLPLRSRAIRRGEASAIPRRTVSWFADHREGTRSELVQDRPRGSFSQCRGGAVFPSPIRISLGLDRHTVLQFMRDVPSSDAFSRRGGP